MVARPVRMPQSPPLAQWTPLVRWYTLRPSNRGSARATIVSETDSSATAGTEPSYAKEHSQATRGVRRGGADRQRLSIERHPSPVLRGDRSRGRPQRDRDQEADQSPAQAAGGRLHPADGRAVGASQAAQRTGGDPPVGRHHRRRRAGRPAVPGGDELHPQGPPAPRGDAGPEPQEQERRVDAAAPQPRGAADALLLRPRDARGVLHRHPRRRCGGGGEPPQSGPQHLAPDHRDGEHAHAHGGHRLRRRLQRRGDSAGHDQRAAVGARRGVQHHPPPGPQRDRLQLQPVLAGVRQVHRRVRLRAVPGGLPGRHRRLLAAGERHPAGPHRRHLLRHRRGGDQRARHPARPGLPLLLRSLQAEHPQLPQPHRPADRGKPHHRQDAHGAAQRLRQRLPLPPPPQDAAPPHQPVRAALFARLGQRSAQRRSAGPPGARAPGALPALVRGPPGAALRRRPGQALPALPGHGKDPGPGAQPHHLVLQGRPGGQSRRGLSGAGHGTGAAPVQLLEGRGAREPDATARLPAGAGAAARAPGG